MQNYKYEFTNYTHSERECVHRLNVFCIGRTLVWFHTGTRRTGGAKFGVYTVVGSVRDVETLVYEHMCSYDQEMYVEQHARIEAVSDLEQVLLDERG